MLIHVGSTRPAKVEGARDAIQAIATVDPRFREAEIRSHDLGDAGPRMPMTEAAIIEGARRRAAALLVEQTAEERGRAPYVVGLEGGLDPLPEPGDPRGYALKTWACVSDGRRWSYGGGGALVLPTAVVREVLAGRELGEVIDGLAGGKVRGTRGGWGLLTRTSSGGAMPSAPRSSAPSRRSSTSDSMRTSPVFGPGPPAPGLRPRAPGPWSSVL